MVLHAYKAVTRQMRMLPCTCGGGVDGVALYRTHVSVEEVREWGLLDENHQWEYEACDGEEVGSLDEEETILCHRCTSRARDVDWQTIDTYTDRVDHEFYVFCQLCEREIEFGWSLEGPEAGIWPVESSDFDPAECRPEPRYAQSWVEKGWIEIDTWDRFYDA